MGLPSSVGRLRQMREARLRRLRKIGPVLAGSVVEVPGRHSYYLTDKVRGKTRTVCVPEAMLSRVRELNENHREAKRLLAELDEIERALLARDIASARETNRQEADGK
jgi:hypothetical protein